MAIHKIVPQAGQHGDTYSISDTGLHFGVRVGNVVFDNVHRSVIQFSEWQNSFTCAGNTGIFRLVILLGTGTSITQFAMRMLASAGVLIGFSGGGTLLLVATEVEWLSPQSEYQLTEYIQNWLSFWFDENKRLEIAKRFQQTRQGYDAGKKVSGIKRHILVDT